MKLQRFLKNKKWIRMNNLKELKEMHSRMHENYEPEEIANCAEQVLRYFKIDESVPIPIVSILNKLNIRTFQKKMSPRDLSAYISINPEYKEKFGSTKIACVNQFDNLGHKRFALAHELAHFLFDYDETKEPVYYNTYKAGQKDEDQVEKRANYFAACLLMPKDKFKQEYTLAMKKANNSMPDTIAMLAERFEVSPKAISKRLMEVKVQE